MRLPRLSVLRPIAVTFALLSCTENGPTGPSLNTSARLNFAGSAQSVVISQVYGGGGNSGATYKNDFIEIFNNGNDPVDLTGWSVQYASSAGIFSSNTPTNLSGTLAPGRYMLIQEVAGTGGTTALPTPDAFGSVAMSGTDGKVALVRSTTGLACGSPAAPCSTATLAQIVDLVGYGSASFFEGGAAAQVLTNTTASLRNAVACTDTDRNSLDFTRGTPVPHNSATVPHICPTTANPVDHVTVAPATATIPYKGTLQLTGKSFSPANAEISSTFPPTWSSSNPSLATVSRTGLVTALGIGDVVITAAATGKTAQATLHLDAPPPPPTVHFSELHYDNSGTDVNEKIEIEGPAGTDLSGWSVVLYGGDASPDFSAYSTTPIAIDLPETCGTKGVIVLDYDVNGIKNGFSTFGGVTSGHPAGMALVDNTGAVVEFLSYEGTFTAVGGPAAGLTSTDMGVSEDPAPAPGNSLHRDSNGLWQAAAAQDFGVCNGSGGSVPATSNRITFSGRLSSDPALPVGFEDQLFGTEKTPSGVTVSTSFTWTSETPAIATIDADGVFRGVSAGNAVLRATATDGTTATTTLPIVVNVFSTTADWSGNLEFGTPTDATPGDDHIITHNQFTSSYSYERNIPNWVSAKLDVSHYGTGSDRCDCFTFDPAVPANLYYNTQNYTGVATQWNRGHLLRSADVEASAGDNSIAYYFSNIAPQAGPMNQGPWAIEENFLGDLAKTGGKDVYEIIGVSGSQGTLKNEGRVTIPANFWKVAVIVPHGRKLADIHSYTDLQVIAVIMPNIAAVNGDWTTYKTTVHAVEQLSGYNLLSNLPDDIELLVENNDRPPTAVLTGQDAGIEGNAVSLDGSTSSDPDGDALTYAWNFGDGSTGTGAHPAHVYADNGQYIVTLTVADPIGATSATTGVVTVSNANPSVVVDAADPIISGDRFTLAGGFGDAGQSDAPWSYVVDWGDGTSSSSTTTVQGALQASHQHFITGTYTVTLTVTDKDGGSGSASTTLQVNPVGATIDLTQGQINVANNGNGEVKITLLGSSLFSASDVVISSVRIGHTFPSTEGNGKPKVRISDVDHDGITDLVAQFRRGELSANGDLSGDTIILSANLTDGRQIQAVLPVSVKDN